MKPLNFLDLQQSMFKLTMEAQAPKAMVEHFDINPTTNLWMTLNNNGLLTQWISEYVNLVENSHCFNVWICARWSHFLQFCLHKRQIIGWANFWTQQSECVPNIFLLKKHYLIGHYKLERSQNVDWCYHFKPCVH